MSDIQNTPPVQHASTQNAGWAYLLMKVLTELLPPTIGAKGPRRHVLCLTAPEDLEKGPMEVLIACEERPVAITLSDEDLVKNPQELAVEIRDLIMGPAETAETPKSPEAIVWEQGYNAAFMYMNTDATDIPANPYL
jgi:hypothetical protein